MVRGTIACLLLTLLAGCSQSDPPATTPVLREAGLTAAEERSIQANLSDILKEADLIHCESNGSPSDKKVRLVLLRRPVKGAPPETPAEAAVREEINREAGIEAPTKALDFVLTFEGQRVVVRAWNHKGPRWSEGSADSGH